MPCSAALSPSWLPRCALCASGRWFLPLRRLGVSRRRYPQWPVLTLTVGSAQDTRFPRLCLCPWHTEAAFLVSFTEARTAAEEPLARVWPQRGRLPRAFRSVPCYERAPRALASREELDRLFSGRVEPRFVPVEEGLFLGAAGGVRVGTGLRKPPEPPSARPCQVDPDTGYINYDRLEENARLFHPKLIIAGGRPGGRRPRASCRPDGTLSPPILAPCASRQAPVGPCGPVRKLWTWRALAGWGREQPGGRSPRT